MKKLFLSVISIFLFLGLIAQNNILLTIDDEKISSEEFERIYQKNKKNFSTGDVISVDEYLDLFVNFKLKVAEAESRGLDTLTSFKREFEGYRKQLIKPYFVDKECKNKLINTAYNRLQYEIRVKHILLKLSPNASAEDTAFVYNKALEIRNRIIKGEKFELVAKGTSDDPSVRNNGGDIGYFTAFQMVYSFEDVAYKLDIGKISYPVRTKFGYHIIQKVDKREAKGQAKVAHIMLTVPRGMQPSKTIEKEKLINEIYHKLKEGEKFADLVKIYSEDRGSAKNGGKLPWFGSGRMVKPFEDAAFELANIGDISKPIRTSFGWHIVKLLDK
ncbi:MAG: peptidylprolyl isomerase, partial [Bacteroidota bacterium]|nr:peptidylprolyl isomerase [Bacteroidota bacterium]